MGAPLRNLCVSILLAALLGTGGCEALGLVNYMMNPPTIKARYVPPKEKTLILVDAQGAAGDAGLDAENLAAALNDNFKEAKIAPTVDPKDLQKLHDDDPTAYDNFTIDGIGKKLDAKQVLYVNITRVDIDAPSGGDQIRGIMMAKVRFVHVSDAKTLWPLGSQTGEIIRAATDWQPNTSPEVQMKVDRDISAKMADSIVKLFKDTESKAPVQSDENKITVE